MEGMNRTADREAHAHGKTIKVGDRVTANGTMDGTVIRIKTGSSFGRIARVHWDSGFIGSHTVWSISKTTKGHT